MFNEQMGQPLLARDVVRYVGEPVAVVVTEGRYQGEDAADLVDVDYEPLPAVVDMAGGRLDDAAAAVPGRGHATWPRPSATPAALAADLFEGCEVVVSQHHRQPAGGARADGDPGRGRGLGRRRPADGVDPEPGRAGHPRGPGGHARHGPGQVRVITPDVGGAFGAKFGADPEHAVVCWVARQLGRPRAGPRPATRT